MERSKNTHCKWCSAINCTNSSNKRPDLSFFHFPSDPERCKKWVINVRRADLENKSAAALSRSNVLCSEHFEACCFSTSATHRKRLLKSAVPTLFKVPNPPPQLSGSRPPPKQRLIPVPSISTSSASPSSVPATEIDNEEFVQIRTSLKRKLKAEQCRSWRLRKKLKFSSESPTDSVRQGSSLEDILKPHLSEAALRFVLTQIRVSKLPHKARRWTFEDKKFALSIYHASRKAYHLLQKVFQLPTPRLLSMSMRNVRLQPGICENILSMFQVKVQAMTVQERLCAIIFDEMTLKLGIRYDPTSDEIEGFEDFGMLGRSQKQANQALVIMVRGLATKWKQPLSYVLSKGPVKSEMLQPLILDAVQRVITLGLTPKVIICDQGSNNRSFMQKLGITKEEPFFYVQGHKIFIMFDPPHLMKSIRNNLKSSGFTVDGQNVIWEYVEKFYEMDSALPIRMAPKLTKRHIQVPPFAHLRVSLAVQVLSHTVAAGITTMVSLKAIPTEATKTAEFIEQFDRLFNCFNGRAIHGKGTMAHAITPNSSHMKFLHESLAWLNGIKGKGKNGANLPCLEGWKLSISCLIQLWEDLKNLCSFKFLLTNRLNQDCLENLFSVIRGKGGHRYNPDPLNSRLPSDRAWSTLSCTQGNAKTAKMMSTPICSALKI